MPAGDSVDHRNWSETAVFRLAKYSRSIPRSDLSCQGQPSTSPASRTTTPAEWSHFSQTGLSLVVETVHVDSQENNRIGTRHQQIILKIIWDNNPSSHKGNLDAAGSTDRPGVFLLEKVNLTQVQETFGHARQVEESPLKANCKDCVVGLRYATGFLDNSFNFNRLQIKLQTPADSLRFIALIEAICPCKISSGIQSSQSSRNSGSQLPVSSNSPGFGHFSSSQPSLLEINTNNIGSQDFCNQTQLSESSQISKKNVHQLPISTNPPALGHSSQQSIEAAPNTTNLQGLGSQAELLESTARAESHPAPSQALHPDNQTTSSPAIPALESHHPLIPEELNNLSDETLMEYIREIVMDPGFNNFVHQVKRLISHEH
ncbi:hypothetical protein PTTG_11827 [Puccinia triticina 1-1 BBBD Race 1]|uniref:Uncharacterized protein n=2 Tax=Puccinia triticina TaxID=208348 RepID=A0A180G246_PUCT1|nr:uncharacterized protein PtA15_1A236 [Puccinia triticina]OAV86704.1 hypothetical protein PTTG_11827 [Puccinia triticina 1-1 BBBD Race 1]WAQ80898.1 hypothetical protein PtA15_1A236 [Puccinia triticina]